MSFDINGLLESLSGLSEKAVPVIDAEIVATENRLAMLQKLRGMCPNNGEKIKSTTVGKMLEGVTARNKKKKPDAARPKREPGEKLNLENDMLPSETRCKMIAGLIDAQGAMTSGALAERMKCSVKTIYNDTYRHEEWFGRDSNGITLTAQGRNELLK